MIDRNHPAVKVMVGPRVNVGNASDMAADRLTAALPHLESATEDNLARLRNTPAGKQLMAEAWTVGAEYAGMGTVDDYDNPYRPEVTP